jgi:hypothetical protein
MDDANINLVLIKYFKWILDAHISGKINYIQWYLVLGQEHLEYFD